MKGEELNQLQSLKDYIKYFQSIPAKKWITGRCVDGRGRHCARGHLGTTYVFAPTQADLRLLRIAPDYVTVNNGFELKNYKIGIKTRVIRYLKSLLTHTNQ